MAMNTGFLQQQPLLNTARVRSAPSPQHGAHMWRPAAAQPAEAVIAPEEEKSFGPPRER